MSELGGTRVLVTGGPAASGWQWHVRSWTRRALGTTNVSGVNRDSQAAQTREPPL
jgi:hypothetical protein